MADLFISYINPIRFRPTGSNNVMPRIDEMENGVQYYKGVYPLPNYKPDWKVNEELVIQIQTDLTEAAAALVYLRITTPSGTTDVNPIDVTPSTWSGTRVLNYNYTPTVEGDYSIRTLKSGPGITQHYISDDFRVRPNDLDLVEIKYSDTDNRFDGVFYDGSTLIWQPKAYFTGISIPGKPTADYDTYTDDSQKPTRTNAETNRVIKVNFTDLSTNHYSQLIDITSCDTLYTNNQPCLNPEIFEEEETEKSDAVNITINMTRIEDNNFVKNY